VAQIIIITDLDGTLLHPETYSFDKAMPSLKLIKERNIPLIFCSSKTRAEIEIYRERLENKHPFISENGGGIFIPEGYFRFPIEGNLKDDFKIITLGRHYNEIRRIFLDIRRKTGIRVRGFGDMNTEDVSLLTGITIFDAGLAKEREFDETFIFEEGEERVSEFLYAIESSGLQWTRGRYYHILGAHDKGKAVMILKGYYEKVFDRIIIIGLGDSINDLTLLRNVDYPVLVRKEDGSYDPGIGLPYLIRANGVGPEGWNEAVVLIIDKIIRENK